MLPCYLVLDLETTGGSGVHDRITEIAAVRLESGRVTQRWSTLVNPGTPIPYFIENLTGISDAMVANAPRFKDVADTLLALLDGAVLVAHNASFDHGFLRGEYARLGHDLRVPSLCTVRLSRKLYPQFKSHGLDALISRHGLHTDARHRAMGDVDMVLAWLAQAQSELGLDRLQDLAQALLQPPLGLPRQLETLVEDVPDSPGVYIFYGDPQDQVPLFIGSALQLRHRVGSHLQSASKSARERSIVANTRRIEWRECAGEVGTLLLCQRLIVQMQPTYGRRVKAPVGVQLAALHPWPYPNVIGLREYDEGSGRTDIHLFYQWRHLATVQDDNDLQAELDKFKPILCSADSNADADSRFAGNPPGYFDLDIYRLLVKRLFSPAHGHSAILQF